MSWQTDMSLKSLLAHTVSQFSVVLTAARWSSYLSAGVCHLSRLVASHLTSLHTSWIIPSHPVYFFCYFLFLFILPALVFLLRRGLVCVGRSTAGNFSHSPNRASASVLSVLAECRPPALWAALTPLSAASAGPLRLPAPPFWEPGSGLPYLRPVADWLWQGRRRDRRGGQGTGEGGPGGRERTEGVRLWCDRPVAMSVAGYVAEGGGRWAALEPPFSPRLHLGIAAHRWVAQSAADCLLTWTHVQSKQP